MNCLKVCLCLVSAATVAFAAEPASLPTKLPSGMLAELQSKPRIPNLVVSVAQATGGVVLITADKPYFQIVAEIKNTSSQELRITHVGTSAPTVLVALPKPMDLAPGEVVTVPLLLNAPAAPPGSAATLWLLAEDKNGQQLPLERGTVHFARADQFVWDKQVYVIRPDERSKFVIKPLHTPAAVTVKGVSVPEGITATFGEEGVILMLSESVQPGQFTVRLDTDPVGNPGPASDRVLRCVLVPEPPPHPTEPPHGIINPPAAK